MSCSQKRQWIYPDEFEPHAECYDCELEYGCDAWSDVVVSDEIWDLIKPSGNKGAGLLCFNCMVRRLAFLGLENVSFEVKSGPFCKLEKG